VYKFVGFNFNKISVEKKKESTKDIKIDTKINLLDIESVDSELTQEGNKIIRLRFLYEVEYSPGIAKIEVGGKIILMGTTEEAEKVMDSWKTKKLDENLRVQAFNIILRKANVKALELEEEMGLPLHLPFPKLKKADGKKE